MIWNVSGIIWMQNFDVLLHGLGRLIVLFMLRRTVTFGRVVVLLVASRTLGGLVVTGGRMAIATVIVVVAVTEFPPW